MKQVALYTDGACSGNPGPGGWGAILRYGEHERELSGGEEQTTNNRMELTAVIEGLSVLKEPCSVDITTDSRYVADAVLKGWLANWQRNGWRNAQKNPVPNRDLWERLISLLRQHEVQFHWVRGHNGHPFNERCDKLAVEAYRKYCR